jgi:endonuclease YncB( thermonuclease family)
MLLIAPADLFGRAPPLGGDLTAQSAQTAVVDGETLLLRDSVVRLLGVAAPARGQICHHADHSGFDCGAAAAAALENLVRDQTVICHLHGRDDQGRALAVCEAAGRELNHALVDGGWARARSELVGLNSDEATARQQHRGFWAGDFDPSS